MGINRSMDYIHVCRYEEFVFALMDMYDRSNNTTADQVAQSVMSRAHHI